MFLCKQVAKVESSFTANKIQWRSRRRDKIVPFSIGVWSVWGPRALGAMEGSSAAVSNSNPISGGATPYLSNLPSRGLFSSTVFTSNPVIFSHPLSMSLLLPYFPLTYKFPLKCYSDIHFLFLTADNDHRHLFTSLLKRQICKCLLFESLVGEGKYFLHRFIDVSSDQGFPVLLSFRWFFFLHQCWCHRPEKFG